MSDEGEQKWTHVTRSRNNSQPLTANGEEKHNARCFTETKDILTDDLPQSLKQFRSEVHQSMVQFRAELRESIDAVFEQWSRKLDALLAEEVQPTISTVGSSQSHNHPQHSPIEVPGAAEGNTTCVEAHNVCADRKELCSTYSLKGVDTYKHEICTEMLQPH